MERHPLHDAKFRNERKRILFEKWIQYGPVVVNFDATRDDVAAHPSCKTDPDYWAQVSECEIYSSHVDFKVKHRHFGMLDFSVPWDAAHSLFSIAFNERHVYVTDIERAKKREEIRNSVPSKKALPS